MVLTFFKSYGIIYIENKKEKKSMELWEAMKLLQEGKKVRRQTWAKDEYIYLDNHVLKDERGKMFTISGDVFGSPIGTWEEYKEGWQNVEVKNIWDLPPGVVDMAMISSANCPYCNSKIVTLKMLVNCEYCPYCGKQVIK